MGEFFPKFGKTPNFSPISGTNLSLKLVNPQICPQILGQIHPQIWWIPKFVLKFGEIFFPKFGESPNLTFCSVSPCPHVFLRRVGSLNLSPHLWENFSPNFGKTPNFSPISVTNSSPKLVNPQICPQILGQIRPKFGKSPNFGTNSSPNLSPKS